MKQAEVAACNFPPEYLNKCILRRATTCSCRHAAYLYCVSVGLALIRVSLMCSQFFFAILFQYFALLLALSAYSCLSECVLVSWLLVFSCHINGISLQLSLCALSFLEEARRQTRKVSKEERNTKLHAVLVASDSLAWKLLHVGLVCGSDDKKKEEGEERVAVKSGKWNAIKSSAAPLRIS